MGEITANVNWLAVIVGAVLAFLLGWLWYSPRLFGTKWAEGSRVQLGQASAMPMAAMVAQAVGTLLFAWVVGVTAASDALWTFILIAVTIAVLVYAGAKFVQKSDYAACTDAGYIVAMAVVLFIVQAIL